MDVETLTAHFASVAEQEGVSVGPEALHLIAKAADGSVRDGLCLLDQAISHAGGAPDADAVRGMLGLADRTRTFDLLESVMKGDIKAALALLAEQYTAGADPAVVLEDMLELVHWLTRIKVVPEAAEAPGVPEAERVRGRDMASTLSMAVVARAWQMLLKGLGETRLAPRPDQAAEMVLVRLAYAADLPTPAEALKTLARPDTVATTPASAPPASTPSTSGPSGPDSPPPPRAAVAVGGEQAAPVPSAAPSAAPSLAPRAEAVVPDPATFQEVVELTGARREGVLHANLINNLHLIHFEPGRIEFRPGDRAPEELAGDLSRFLNETTARRWIVTVSAEAGASTLKQQEDAGAAAKKASAAEHPLVKAVMDTFPGATIGAIGPAEPPEEN